MSRHITRALLVLLFLISCHNAAQSQATPRSVEKLVDRAQEYWRVRGRNQSARAAEFVLPSKREKFLNAQPFVVTSAVVVGIEFGEAPDHAKVKTNVKGIPVGLAMPVELTFTDNWVWMNNNWF